MDKTMESGKIKGGGIHFMTNNNWCDPRNISVLSCSCSPQLEHLAILCQPCYLPTIVVVYISPHVDTDTALALLHNINNHHSKHPDTALIVVGDFNKTNLTKVMLNFFQHVTYPTWGPTHAGPLLHPPEKQLQSHSTNSFW